MKHIRARFNLVIIFVILLLTSVIFTIFVAFWNPSIPNHSETISFYYYHRDSIASFVARKRTEFFHRNLLRSLPANELDSLSQLYYRNISYHYSRDLLPPSLQPPNVKCLHYLQKHYGTSVSIVIVFHNELLVLLLRTLTTIIHRTSPQYLREIILIDDFSQVDFSTELLAYCQAYKIPVIYTRNSRQLGIGISRLKGVTMATSKVTVILDSHVEVMDIWLEPLLQTLEYHPGGIAVPCIRLLQEADPSSECTPYEVYPRYGFNFIEVKQARRRAGNDPAGNYLSSALLGGSLAAYTDTLQKFFPRTLAGNSWSVENTRLSLRIWLCGEGIRVSSCSQVVHRNSLDVFLMRYRGSNIFPMLKAENVAEILNFIPESSERDAILSKAFDQDEYKQLSLKYSIDIKNSFTPEEFACKNYTYYLRHAMKEYVSFQKPEFKFVGEVESLSMPGMCLDVQPDQTIGLFTCRNASYTIADPQVFGFTMNDGIRTPHPEQSCVDMGNYKDKIFTYMCHTFSPTQGVHYASQNIEYAEATSQIKNSKNFCIEAVGTDVKALPCNAEKSEQKWMLKPAPWFK